MDATKERILDLSERLFFRFGFQRVTTEEIAREAGISKRTLYELFPSKSDIVLQSFQRASKDVDAFFETHRFVDHASYFRELLNFLHLMVTVNARYSTPMLEDLQQADEALFNSITTYHRRYLGDRLREVLQNGVVLGCLRTDISLDVMVVVISTAVQYLLHPDQNSALPHIKSPSPDVVFSTILDGILIA